MLARAHHMAAFLLGVALPGIACAQAPATSAPSPSVACEALADMAVPDARIVSADPVETSGFMPPSIPPYAPDLAQRTATLPAFCRVEAVALPTSDSKIGIEVWLPLRDWNGRMLGTGNGGPGGSIAYAMGMVEGLKRGFAVVNSDLGTAPDINLTVDHPERWTDFGHRATHEMTRVAKLMVRSFYKVDSFGSYFAGCSTGGQQALSEATRYPDDYDGILAVAPGNNRTHVATSFLWSYNALNATSESALSAADWSLVNRAVLDACAGKDGGSPGDVFLTDPRQCRFNPDTLPKCTSGTSGDACLTEPQLATVRRIHAGPTNPRTGERIYAPLTLGSEDQPLGPVEQGDPVVWPAQQFYPFKWAFGADFTPASFDFDRDLDRLDALLASPLNANSADLSAFARRGGKLMLFSGLADPAVPFEEVVNYYERVVASRGDLEATQSFARLFLVPGMGHCFGGPGVTDFGQPFSSAVPPEQAADALMTLVEWSEKGVAPNTVIATKAAGRNAPTAPAGQRPLCAYPKLPEYTGGDPENLSSFRCVEHERGSPMTPATRYLN